MRRLIEEAATAIATLAVTAAVGLLDGSTQALPLPVAAAGDAAVVALAQAR